MKISFALALLLISASSHAGTWLENIQIKKITLDLANESAVVTYKAPKEPYIRGSLADSSRVAPIIKSSLQNAMIALLDQARMAERPVWLYLSDEGEISRVELDR